jgi:Reverse transcriptase (RNA-dependent DNA polymerase)
MAVPTAIARAGPESEVADADPAEKRGRPRGTGKQPTRATVSIRRGKWARHAAAHGYRPGRSGTAAITAVHVLLCRGDTDVVDADLSKYFDTIAHQELMRSVARRIVDRPVLRLIRRWRKAPVEERDDDGTRRMTGGKNSKRGTPQGGVISPLLANLYMNRFLKHWRGTGDGRSTEHTSSAVPTTWSFSAAVMRPRRWRGRAG